MRRAAKLLALSVSIALLPISLANGAIAGSKCSKSGTIKIVSNIKYTCIKQGGKLVWNKGVSIKPAEKPTQSPNPTPSPTPTSSSSPSPEQSAKPNPSPTGFSPWTTTSSPKELSDAAQLEFKKWITSNSNNLPNHKLFVEEGVPQNRVKFLIAADQLDAKLFSRLVPGGSVTVIGKSNDWVVKKLNENGGKFESCSENAGEDSIYYCVDDQRGLHGYILKKEASYDPQNPAFDGSTLLSHEYFHIVQRGMLKAAASKNSNSNGAGSNQWTPAWLLEGSANFVGFSIAAHVNDAKYWDGYNAMLGYAPQDKPSTKNKLIDYEVRTCCGNDKPTYPYIMGQLASQYIVASIGFEKFLNLWAGYENNLNFEDNFKKATGLSKENFYKNFEELRVSIGLPKVSWTLVCENNLIVNKEISKLTSAEASSKFVAYECQPGSMPSDVKNTNNNSNPNQSQTDSTNNADNLLEKACVNLGEEKTTFYLWVCVNEKNRGKIWIRKGTESQYQLQS